MPSISAMFGGVDYCYAHRPIDASNASSCHEYNVAENASASRAMVAASWPMVITPLDTCEVAMSGAPWAQMQAELFRQLVATALPVVVVAAAALLPALVAALAWTRRTAVQRRASSRQRRRRHGRHLARRHARVSSKR